MEAIVEEQQKRGAMLRDELMRQRGLVEDSEALAEKYRVEYDKATSDARDREDALQRELEEAWLSRLQRDLLARVQGTGLRRVILDATAVETMDSVDFQGLRQTFDMLALMGAVAVIVFAIFLPMLKIVESIGG